LTDLERIERKLDLIERQNNRVIGLLLELWPENAKVKSEADAIRERLKNRRRGGIRRHERATEKE
jgi:hypothetical protein